MKEVISVNVVWELGGTLLALHIDAEWVTKVFGEEDSIAQFPLLEQIARGSFLYIPRSIYICISTSTYIDTWYSDLILYQPVSLVDMKLFSKIK